MQNMKEILRLEVQGGDIKGFSGNFDWMLYCDFIANPLDQISDKHLQVRKQVDDGKSNGEYHF